MLFKISIQNPFNENEEITENVSANEAQSVFRNIDWGKLNGEIFTRQNEIKQHFYFYEISSENRLQKRTLTVSPEYDTKENIAKEEILFMVRYEYPHPEKEEEFLDYRYEQITFNFAQESVDAFIKDDRDFFLQHFETQTPRNKNLKRGGCLKQSLWAIFLMIAGLFAFLHFVVGWNHISEHWLNLKMSLFPEKFTNDPAIEAEIAQGNDSFTSDTTEVEPALESPIDTIIWANAIKKGDYIPPGVKEELQRYKKRDFSKLIKSEDKPTDQEAQQAIVRYYQIKVSDLLKQYEAHIKIGTCYNAPLQKASDDNPEIVRVTAMVSAFNKKTGNIGNIQTPLDIVYDFVKYQSDPDTWYLADFSQNIPYDYQLNKDRLSN